MTPPLDKLRELAEKRRHEEYENCVVPVDDILSLIDTIQNLQLQMRMQMASIKDKTAKLDVATEALKEIEKDGFYDQPSRWIHQSRKKARSALQKIKGDEK